MADWNGRASPIRRSVSEPATLCAVAISTDGPFWFFGGQLLGRGFHVVALASKKKKGHDRRYDNGDYAGDVEPGRSAALALRVRH